MPHKPRLGMIGMESMVTINTKHHKTTDNLVFRRTVSTTTSTTLLSRGDAAAVNVPVIVVVTVDIALFMMVFEFLFFLALGICCNRGAGHGIWRTEPERAHAASRHVPETFGADGAGHKDWALGT